MHPIVAFLSDSGGSCFSVTEKIVVAVQLVSIFT